MQYTIDFHSHSFWSDGDASPEQLVSRANKAGIDFLVLTDHASVRGFEAFIENCKKLRIGSISGVELTCVSGLVWLDILVYNFDIHEVSILHYMEQNKVSLKSVCDRYVSYLQNKKIPISWETVLEYYKLPFEATPSLYMINKYRRLVLLHRQDEIQVDIKDAGVRQIDRSYLYLSILPKLSEVTEISKKNGMLVSLAHPSKTSKFIARLRGLSFNRSMDELFALVIHNGIEAIEVSHPSYCNYESDTVRKFCKENKLLMTGGSDYHGDGEGEHKEGVHFGQYGLMENEFDAIIKRLNR